MATSRTKTDNHVASKEAELDLRRRVLAELPGAHVLDAFCGTGEMYRGAWALAAGYAGCDEREWNPKTDPPRYVADNRRLLRCIDLQQFRIFDFDAYGSPWDLVEILLARRSWAAGERGGLVLTDGTSLKLRWGQIPGSMARLSGVRQGVPTTAPVEELQHLALTGWVNRAGVRILRMWTARGRPPADVRYTGLVFEGGAAPVEPGA